MRTIAVIVLLVGVITQLVMSQPAPSSEKSGTTKTAAPTTKKSGRNPPLQDENQCGAKLFEWKTCKADKWKGLYGDWEVKIQDYKAKFMQLMEQRAACFVDNQCKNPYEVFKQRMAEKKAKYMVKYGDYGEGRVGITLVEENSEEKEALYAAMKEIYAAQKKLMAGFERCGTDSYSTPEASVFLEQCMSNAGFQGYQLYAADIYEEADTEENLESDTDGEEDESETMFYRKYGAHRMSSYMLVNAIYDSDICAEENRDAAKECIASLERNAYREKYCGEGSEDPVARLIRAKESKIDYCSYKNETCDPIVEGCKEQREKEYMYLCECFHAAVTDKDLMAVLAEQFKSCMLPVLSEFPEQVLNKLLDNKTVDEIDFKAHLGNGTNEILREKCHYMKLMSYKSDYYCSPQRQQSGYYKANSKVDAYSNSYGSYNGSGEKSGYKSNRKGNAGSEEEDYYEEESEQDEEWEGGYANRVYGFGRNGTRNSTSKGKGSNQGGRCKARPEGKEQGEDDEGPTGSEKSQGSSAKSKGGRPKGGQDQQEGSNSAEEVLDKVKEIASELEEEAKAFRQDIKLQLMKIGNTSDRKNQVNSVINKLRDMLNRQKQGR